MPPQPIHHHRLSNDVEREPARPTSQHSRTPHTSPERPLPHRAGHHDNQGHESDGQTHHMRTRPSLTRAMHHYADRRVRQGHGSNLDDNTAHKRHT